MVLDPCDRPVVAGVPQGGEPQGAREELPQVHIQPTQGGEGLCGQCKGRDDFTAT